jgi:hypothetical protein
MSLASASWRSLAEGGVFFRQLFRRDAELARGAVDRIHARIDLAQAAGSSSTLSM